MGIRIHLSSKDGRDEELVFDKLEVTFGRITGNDIVLPHGNISKRHCRLVVKDGKPIIVDLQSVNGTFVNGKKVQAPQVIKTGSDKIYIGDYIVEVMEVNFERRPRMTEPPPPPPGNGSWAQGIDESTNPGLEAFHEQATPPSGTPLLEVPEAEHPTQAPPPPELRASDPPRGEDPLGQRIHRLALRLIDNAEAKASSGENPLVRAMLGSGE